MVRRSGAKCGNKKVVVDGITYASKREAKRGSELLLLEKSGAISDLQMQVKFELLPSQRIDGKVVERACSYIADFVYIDTATGQKVVEDAKGYRDPSSAVYAKFVIKRKMMLYFHGIKIKEI